MISLVSLPTRYTKLNNIFIDLNLINFNRMMHISIKIQHRKQNLKKSKEHTRLGLFYKKKNDHYYIITINNCYNIRFGLPLRIKTSYC